MLARSRMSHAAIRDAILRIDDSKMSMDRLKSIRSSVPNQKEVSDIDCMLTICAWTDVSEDGCTS